MGPTQQAIQHIAVQQSDELRAKFMADVLIYDPSMLIWINKSRCDRCNCMRKWGYSVSGLLPQGHRLLVQGTRYSAIPVMTIEGILEVYLMEGNVNSERFEEFIMHYLISISTAL